MPNRYEDNPATYGGMDTGNYLRLALTQKMAQEKAQNDLAIAQHASRADLGRAAITALADATKAGAGGGVEALLTNLNVIPSGALLGASGMTDANNAGLALMQSQGFMNRGQGLKDMANAGYSQLSPNGAIDLTNTAPVIPHMTPGDMASMARANQEGTQENTIQWLSGDKVITAKQKGKMPIVDQGAPAIPQTELGGGPASGASPTTKQKIDLATQKLVENGYNVKPIPQKDGTTILELKHSSGMGGVQTLVIDKDGNRIK